MPRYAVRPDDLGDAAALTATDGSALQDASRLAGAAADGTVAALGGEAGTLAAAVEDYAQVERAVAASLTEAARILSGALAEAAVGYARADSVVGIGFGGPSTGADP
jgi:hypothetical protein